jgi:hypothetical protein
MESILERMKKKFEKQTEFSENLIRKKRIQQINHNNKSENNNTGKVIKRRRKTNMKYIINENIFKSEEDDKNEDLNFKNCLIERYENLSKDSKLLLQRIQNNRSSVPKNDSQFGITYKPFASTILEKLMMALQNESLILFLRMTVQKNDVVKNE